MPPKKYIIAALLIAGILLLVLAGAWIMREATTGTVNPLDDSGSLLKKEVVDVAVDPTSEDTEYTRIQDKYGETACSRADSQVELSSCLQGNFKSVDEILNGIYTEVENLCSEDVPSCTEELLSAQKAWIAFRDESCELESRQSYGGSAYDDYVTNCLIGYMRERTEYFKQFLGNP